jgi:SAM-dependent methyltransferase
VVGDAERPPAAARGAWDLVQSSFTLFFLPDLAAALARYRVLLRPGGRLAFSWFGADDERWGVVSAAMAAELPRERRGAHRPGGSAFESVVARADALGSRRLPGRDDRRADDDRAIRDGATWWDNRWRTDAARCSRGSAN